MKEIVFATHNNHKAAELQDWFSRNFGDEYKLVTLRDLGLGEPVEDGATFADNAYIKAKYALDLTGKPAIADDSGLCVDYLGGAPGVYSARFAGEGGTPDDCIRKLLAEMQGVPRQKRTAKFVCAICLLNEKGERIDAYGETNGYITEAKQGGGDFGYDPVFYCPAKGKTFAELDIVSKSSVSHRGRALQDLKNKICQGF